MQTDSTRASAQSVAAFLPDWSRENPYQNLLMRALTAQNVRVVLQQFASGFFSLNRTVNSCRELRVIHLHWVNDLISHILWTRNPLIARLKLLLLGLDILMVRARGVRVVWTIHNAVAHESGNTAREIQARRMIARTCNRVIIHSASALRLVEERYRISLSSKTSVIPHGNYDGCYTLSDASSDALKSKLHLEASNIAILFFGAIRRYKGVDKLLKVFAESDNPDLRLILAGRPNSEELRAEILDYAKRDTRIIAMLDFIHDDEVAALFAVADIVAIPFERTLTSGSAVLAVSMARPLLLPAEARVLDLVDDDCAFFFHDETGLKTAIANLRKDQLNAMRGKARAIADELSWSKIGAMTAEAYRN